MLLSESSQKLDMSNHPPDHSRIHREVVWSPDIEYTRSEVYSSIILPVYAVSSVLSLQAVDGRRAAVAIGFRDDDDDDDATLSRAAE